MQLHNAAHLGLWQFKYIWRMHFTQTSHDSALVVLYRPKSVLSYVVLNCWSD